MIETVLNNRYHIDTVIAHGARDIYRATDLSTQHPVRLDIYYLGDNDHASFQSAADQSRSLTHPNLRTPIDTWTTNNKGHIIYPAIDGHFLSAKLPDLVSLSFAAKCDFLGRIADAISHLHTANLLPESFNLADIWIDTDNNPSIETFFWQSPRLHEQALPASFIFHPTYSAPEVINGNKMDESATQYMLAVLAYQLLSNNQLPHPVAEDSTHMMHVLLQRLQADPTPIRQFAPDLPTQVETIFTTALARDPQERYPTLAAFLAALRDALG